MEDTDLKIMWKEYDRRLEEARILNLQAWAVSRQTFEYLQTHKAKTKLNSLARFKGAAVLLGLIWAAFLGLLVYGNAFRNVYFSISVGMLLLFSIIAVVVYIKHIVLIRQINYSENITTTQQKLAELQVSTLRVGRVLWLQLPFYSTWFWNSEWIRNNTLNFLLIALPIALLFTFLAVWLYRNISFKNVDKKWFRILFKSNEWVSVVQAMDYLKEIREFKNG